MGQPNKLIITYFKELFSKKEEDILSETTKKIAKLLGHIIIYYKRKIWDGKR